MFDGQTDRLAKWGEEGSSNKRSWKKKSLCSDSEYRLIPGFVTKKWEKIIWLAYSSEWVHKKV